MLNTLHGYAFHQVADSPDLEIRRAVHFLLHALATLFAAQGRTMAAFGLPPPTDPITELQRLTGALTDDVKAAASAAADTDYGRMDGPQRAVFNHIMAATRLAAQSTAAVPSFYLDAPGGYGKTFVINTLIRRLNGAGHIVVATASSGIAALNMPGGQTAHSAFGLSLDPQPGDVASISPVGGRADVLRATKLIIWDEISMSHGYHVAAFDRMLQRVCNNDAPFGGKVVLFAGDFRQTAPVVKGGTASDIVAASVTHHDCWSSVTRLRLSTPHRQRDHPLFAHYLLALGENRLPSVQLADQPGFARAPAGSTTVLDIDDLIAHVYGHAFWTLSRQELCSRAILATTNSCIDEINSLMLTLMSEGSKDPIIDLIACDKQRTEDAAENGGLQVAPEILNAVSVPGVPKGTLRLCVGAPVIFLRNINMAVGMANGQKGTVTRINPRSVVVSFTDPRGVPVTVTVPRIDFRLQTGPRGVHFARRQYPLALAFATTFHKCQGLTLDRVGVDLRNQPFAHGMSYVALSRARSPDKLFLLAPPTAVDAAGHALIRNITYPALLAAALQGLGPRPAVTDDMFPPLPVQDAAPEPAVPPGQPPPAPFEPGPGNDFDNAGHNLFDDLLFGFDDGPDSDGDDAHPPPPPPPPLPPAPAATATAAAATDGDPPSIDADADVDRLFPLDLHDAALDADDVARDNLLFGLAHGDLTQHLTPELADQHADCTAPGHLAAAAPAFHSAF